MNFKISFFIQIIEYLQFKGVFMFTSDGSNFQVLVLEVLVEGDILEELGTDDSFKNSGSLTSSNYYINYTAW